MNHTVKLKPLQETEVKPAAVRRLADQSLFLDFGKAVFGTLLFKPAPLTSALVVHLGEKLDGAGRIERNPPGTIRYRRIGQPVVPGAESCRVAIPPDGRNTAQNAIRMPAETGEVLPFRYAEIEDAAAIDPATVRQIFVHYPFDDSAAAFESSDPTLNAVWELCKHTIKATTFCGVYVDGDRERIPYEGDAYINQLGHYCMDHEYGFARFSHEYMMQNPTWCSEWHLHSVMMAWADYLYSGESASLEMFHDDLRAKTLIDFAREDGLISVAPELRTREMEQRLEPHFARGVIRRDIRDVMDWPPGSFTDGGTGERDNHDMLPINTVTNAFHCQALKLMAQIAAVLGRAADRNRFAARAAQVAARINAILFDPGRGVYVDGEGSRHASLHSNMFMLAFGLVPQERRRRVVEFVKSRGMACSVYGAQHLLEALYLNDEDHYALELMTARHDRSWWNMIAVGSTMTLEAWDLKYKKNLDWNHAWGAAPANIVGRHLLGVRPLEPGFARTLIQPRPGALAWVRGTVPTPLGPVAVALEGNRQSAFELTVEIPAGMTARIGLPRRAGAAGQLVVDGHPVATEAAGGHLFADIAAPGHHQVTRPSS